MTRSLTQRKRWIFGIGFILFLIAQKWLSPPAKNIPSIPEATSAAIAIATATNSATISATVSNDWFAGKEKAVVDRIVDGDTIVLVSGKKVRYIGIDTPETVDRSQPVQCFGKQASMENKRLVEGKEVWLEKDVSETDRYGRLLRYVYVLEDGKSVDGDGLTFVNQYLVAHGYAAASSYPPDIKYQKELRNLEATAREKKVGMWADDACTQ